MARDVKLVQRGVNVQANDLAVPPGTPIRAMNIDYQRDGVAASRDGFQNFYTGLPWCQLDPMAPVSGVSMQTIAQPEVRGIYELWSRDRPMMIHGGFAFAYESDLSRWMSVPISLATRFTFFGTFNENALPVYAFVGIGRGVRKASYLYGAAQSPFNSQHYSPGVDLFVGTPGNAANDYQDSGGGEAARFGSPADVVYNEGGTVPLVSDGYGIKSGDTGALLVGSYTATGTANGASTAATFSGASWMASPPASAGWAASAAYVVDNSNQIRQVQRVAGIWTATTFAGSVTAGTTDGTGTAARFTSLVGLTYGGGFLWTLEAGGTIRKISSGGVVTTVATGLGTYAGGIEYVGGSLYVADTATRSIKVVTTGGSASSYAGGVTATDLVGGSFASASFPNGVIRGKYLPYGGSTKFLVVECRCGSDTNLMDIALVPVTSSSGEQSVYHIVRCPYAYPDGASGPNKFDVWGPNLFALSTARGVDAGNGVVFTSSERPQAIDIWTRLNSTDPMPSFRSLGINAPCAPSVSAIAGSALSAGTAVAYRVLVGERYADGRIALGPPSERVVLIGSATATWAGSLTAYAPHGINCDADPFVQVYRTRSISSVTDPGDQMFLCYESTITPGVSGLLFTDQLPDDLLGAELYTNTTEDGVGATSLPPPVFANDVASFSKRVTLANYNQLATVTLKVLGASSLVAGTSTITLTGSLASYAVTLTAIAGATSPTSNSFQIASGGTAAQNAVQTARNIATVINRSPDCYMLTAYYDESDPGTVIVTYLLPGLSRNVTASNTVAKSAKQASISFSTNASTSIISTGSSDMYRKQNASIYSDVDAFDSFPAVNEFTIGSGAEGILRLLPISDTLLAVKDDTVWRMDNAFDPTIYDKALSCSLPDSFAMVNNQWIGLFSRGFVSLSAAQGVALGRPIDREVTGQYGKYSGSFTVDLASAAAIDAHGNYLCAFNKRAFVYNIVASAWSEWVITQLSEQSSGESAIRTVGAFLDSFVVGTSATPRGVLWQRRYQRDGGSWYKNFAESAINQSGVLAADLSTIAVSAYSVSGAAGSLPPRIWQLPSGSETNERNELAEFLWSVVVTQGGTTEDALCTVAVADPESATSAMTVTTHQPLTTIAAGTVTITLRAPVIHRVQYAPFASPGDNAGFGDFLVTVERAQPGWLVGRFFGRQDLGDATEQAVGWMSDDAGISRAVLMPSLTSAGSSGISDQMKYSDVQRFAVPGGRANDQILGLELWHGCAWDPFSIKAVTVQKAERENSKVTR